LQIKTEIISCHTADSKPVKQEDNGTVILPPFVFPDWSDRKMIVKEFFDITAPVFFCVEIASRLFKLNTFSFYIKKRLKGVAKF